jgi:hypothetical protein
LVKTVTGPAHTVTNTYEQNRNTLDVKENRGVRWSVGGAGGGHEMRH